MKAYNKVCYRLKNLSKVNKGYKVFISYKYADSSVFQMPDRKDEGGYSTARHYVDIIQEKLEYLDYINKGEKDGENLSEFKDETIESHLRNKIYDVYFHMSLSLFRQEKIPLIYNTKL